jgi:hypothetical protein
MAGYIGKSQGVTQVDGYTTSEADSEFVNDPNGALNISSSASADSATIDASGNLMVGKSDTTYNNAGVLLREGGSAEFTKSGGAVVNFNRLASDGDIARFHKNGTTVGSIGNRSSNLSIGSGDVSLEFNSPNDAILPSSTSTNNTRDAAIDLGLDTVRFKDLYLSGGVYLGGTGSANKLDDYEEGTWTPSLAASTTNPTPTAVTVNSATYTKIGNTVSIRAYIAVNLTSTGAGGARINGLPFTANNYSPVLFTHGDLIQSTGGYVNSGTTTINAVETYGVNTKVFSGTGQKYLMIMATYKTDS